MPETVVVVGASLAGVRAVEALRDEGHAGRIVLIGDEPHLPYDRPPLSKQVLVGDWPAEQVALLEQADWADLDVELRLGVRAESLDVAGHEVRLDTGERVRYDGVVIATGARARALPGLPLSAPGVHTLRSLDDALRLRRALLDGARRLGVIGGGFIGSEVAYGVRSLGLEVTVFERAAGPMAEVLGAQVAEGLAALQVARGVDLRTRVEVSRVVPRDERSPVQVHTADGEVHAFDEVLVSIGSVPQVEWLAGSSLRVEHGVVCEPTLFAGDDVVAAGDVVRIVEHDGSVRRRVEHWTDAGQQGQLAAANLLAGRTAAEPYTALPYVWSDQFGLRIEVIGEPVGADEVVEVPVAEGAATANGGNGVGLHRYRKGGRTVAYVGIGVPREILSRRRAAPGRDDLAKTDEDDRGEPR